jgi:hypothetical protein
VGRRGVGHFAKEPPGGEVRSPTRSTFRQVWSDSKHGAVSLASVACSQLDEKWGATRRALCGREGGTPLRQQAAGGWCCSIELEFFCTWVGVSDRRLKKGREPGYFHLL